MMRRGQADAPAGRHGGFSIGTAEHEPGAASTALLNTSSSSSLPPKDQRETFAAEKQCFYFNFNMSLKLHFYTHTLTHDEGSTLHGDCSHCEGEALNLADCLHLVRQ